jgi:hypothetical protein
MIDLGSPVILSRLGGEQISGPVDSSLRSLLGGIGCRADRWVGARARRPAWAASDPTIPLALAKRSLHRAMGGKYAEV